MAQNVRMAEITRMVKMANKFKNGHLAKMD